jgi:phage gp29-like protein
MAYDLARSSKKRRQGRPANIEAEKTVAQVAGGLLSPLFSVKNGQIQWLSTDEIIQRHGWKIYKEMMADDQVKACIAFKSLLVRGRAWDIKPQGEGETKEKVAKFLDFNLRRINFGKKVREALTAYQYGFSIAEILWEIGEYEGQTHVLLKDLKFRDPSTVVINTDIHGNIQFYEQETGLLQPKVKLEKEKMFHWAYNGEFSDHYGRSDLRAAYKNWWAKKFIIQFWNVALERVGSPMTITKYPVGASTDLKATLQEILKSLSSKTEILIPEGVEIELLGAERQGKGDFKDACEYHDNAISRAILVPALLGVSSGGPARGSDSQSRLHLRVLFKTADYDGKELMAEMEQQVFRQLIDYNFPNVEEYPCFIWQDYGEFEAMEIADSIRLLHNAGIIDMDQEDVNYARSILGLPIRGENDEEDEVLRPEPAPMGQGGMGAGADGTPGSSGQNNTRAKKGASTKSTKTSGSTVTKMEQDILAALTQPEINMQPQEVVVKVPAKRRRKVFEREEDGRIVAVVEEEVQVEEAKPEVVVHPPRITMSPPEITVHPQEIVVNMPAEAATSKRKVFERDPDTGQIIGYVEE